MRNQKVRCWIFRVSNPESLLPVEEWEGVKYAVWQLEIGDEGTVHYQGYLSFEEPVRMAFIKSLEGLHGAHLQKRRGTKLQAMTYNSKDDTRLEGPYWWPSQEFVVACCNGGEKGKRNDLIELATMVKASLTDHEIADYRPQYVIKFQRGIHALRSAHFTDGRDASEIDSVVYVGPTGTGKSRRLRLECPPGRDWFWVAKGKWFDGYQGEPGLVFDEFRASWMSHSELLSLIDVYPKRVEFKGGMLQMMATRFRFSTNVHPADWYAARPHCPPWLDDPLRRRLRRVVPMEEVYVGAEVQVQDEAAHLIRRPPDGQAPLAPDPQGVLMWNGRDYE